MTQADAQAARRSDRPRLDHVVVGRTHGGGVGGAGYRPAGDVDRFDELRQCTDRSQTGGFDQLIGRNSQAAPLAASPYGRVARPPTAGAAKLAATRLSIALIGKASTMFDNDLNFGAGEEAQVGALSRAFKRKTQESKTRWNWIFYTILFVVLASIIFAFPVVAFDWDARVHELPNWIGAGLTVLTAWSKANIKTILMVVGSLLLSGLSLAIGWYVLSDIYVWITGKELSDRSEN